MHNSPQTPISPRKLTLCATANELSFLFSTQLLHSLPSCFGAFFICKTCALYYLSFVSHTHMKPKCPVSVSAVRKSTWYPRTHSAEHICLQFHICLTVLSAAAVDNL